MQNNKIKFVDFTNKERIGKDKPIAKDQTKQRKIKASVDNQSGLFLIGNCFAYYLPGTVK